MMDGRRGTLFKQGLHVLGLELEVVAWIRGGLLEGHSGGQGVECCHLKGSKGILIQNRELVAKG
jgi:hypothetical protein